MKYRKPVIKRIGGKILVMFLTIGIAAVLIISTVSIRIAANALRRESFNLQAYFNERIDDTEVLATLFFIQEINKPIFKILRMIITIAGVIVIILIFTAIIFSKRISNPINMLMAVTKRIAQGDLKARAEVKSSGETGELAGFFNLMAQSNEEAIWLKTGLNELSSISADEQDLQTFSRSAVIFLSKYVNAVVGAFYAVDENQVLTFIAGYAYSDKHDNFKQYKIGEGLVGQAALEKKSILFDSIPEKSVKINYGLGEVPPGYFLITPVIYKSLLRGVIELGSVDVFTAVQKEFIEQAAEKIGSEINSIESRKKIQELLQETRNKAEELKAQQEALQKNNEELEAQAEELQAQQEELLAYTEELQKINRLLKEQKEEIEAKNRALIEANQTIKDKAVELTKSSNFKSEFLANMSHELRTPLNSILILSKLLTENTDGNLKEEQKESAEVIYKSGSSLLSLINDILDISKIEAGKMEIEIERLRLSDFASDIEINFRHMADDKKVAFSADLAGDLPEYILTDEKKLMQIIKNLIANALKFTERGEVRVVIRRPGSRARLTNINLDPGKAVAIDVIDTGIGISAEKQQIIFEAFKQADAAIGSKYGGTGLGLSISNNLAWYLGGEIQLMSEPKKGSTFTLYLPEKLIWEAQAFEEKGIEIENKSLIDISDKKPKPKLAGYITDDRKEISPDDKTLLIMENDPGFTKTLVNMARKSKFKYLVAENGETGLQFSYEYDLQAIILDLELPGMSGIKVLDRLKDNLKTRHIPVYTVSFHDGSNELLKRGTAGHITRPAGKKQINGVFTALDNIIDKNEKHILLIGDAGPGKKIDKYLKSKNIKITTVEKDQDGFKLLQSEDFDLIVIDLNTLDSKGIKLLDKIVGNDLAVKPPVLIYGKKELLIKKNIKLERYAESIIIKSVNSSEKLLDEATLFLHIDVKDLAEEQEKMLKVMHKEESILKDKNILVVDDEMRNTFALAKVLRKSGIKVQMAENGKKALELLERKPGIDLVLMDIMMPVMDGYEAMSRIRQNERLKDIPIIALTAKAMKGDRAKCIEAGANDYISKPIDTDKLVSMLKVWLYR